MCLGSYINRIPAESLPTVPADTVFDRSSSEKPLHSCVRLHEIWTNILVGSLLTGHMLQSVTTAAYSHFTHTQPTHIYSWLPNTGYASVVNPAILTFSFSFTLILFGLRPISIPNTGYAFVVLILLC